MPRTCGWHALWLSSLSHSPRLCHVIEFQTGIKWCFSRRVIGRKNNPSDHLTGMKRFSENALVERSGSRGVIAIARTMSFVRDDVRRGGYVAKHPPRHTSGWLELLVGTYKRFRARYYWNCEAGETRDHALPLREMSALLIVSSIAGLITC